MLEEEPRGGASRRAVLQTATAAGTLALGPSGAEAIATAAATTGWEWGPMRWGQVVFTDDDPGRDDLAEWMAMFERAHVEGAILSAGGVTAFYPTKVPHHSRSEFLGDDDLLGRWVKACRDRGLRILARVDPHAMRASTFAAHPEWAARAPDGTAKRHPAAQDMYLTCGNGPVTFEFIPKVITEIIETYKVDGIFGNRWGGSTGVCYCATCRGEFRSASGFDIPRQDDPQDPARRAYLIWEEEKRFAQIKLWNDTAASAKPEAFFAPGTTGRLDPNRLRKTIRASFADRQARRGQDPAWLNGKSAKETAAAMQGRPIIGISSIGPTITAYRFIDSVQNPAEIEAYLHDGLAHGFRPLFGKFKAELNDRRFMPPVEKVYAWHHRNVGYFKNTANLARVAIVQSAQTSTYYARGNEGMGPPGFGTVVRPGAEEAANGYYQALVEARIPFEIVDDRQLEPEFVDRYRVLVLPNIAALSDRQCDQLRGYVARGGRLVATLETSLYDEWGKRRANFGLADLFGCDFAGKVDERVQNSYISIRSRHPLTRGLDGVPRVIGGTKLVHVTAVDRTPQPLTQVPSYPDLPMERVFTKQPQTDIPSVYARAVGKGRVCYFPADLDRTFWEIPSNDHLALLRNAVEWAADEPSPMTLSGQGLFDISYWRQGGSLTAHIVNLTNPMMMKGYMREIIPAGPVTVSLQLPKRAQVKSVRLLKADRPVRARYDGERLVVDVPKVRIHEVVAIDLA